MSTNNGWTRHGRPIPYVTQDGPPLDSRPCSGPPTCTQCREDVAEVVQLVGGASVIPDPSAYPDEVVDTMQRLIRDIAKVGLESGLRLEWRFITMRVQEVNVGNRLEVGVPGLVQEV